MNTKQRLTIFSNRMDETQESFIVVVLVESDGVVFVTNRGLKGRDERERKGENKRGNDAYCWRECSFKMSCLVGGVYIN